MLRLILSATVMLFTATGCDRTPEGRPAATSALALPTSEQGAPAAVQDSVKPEITAARISGDLVGRKVRISELTQAGPPTEWHFEADEFRQVNILNVRPVETGLAITIFLTTRSNPQSSADDVLGVSGRLLLHYERKRGNWVLARIENLTFRYSLGVST